MTPLFDANVWYMDDDPDNPEGECVHGEGEQEYVGTLAHLFQQLRKDEHRIRLVDIRRLSP